MIQNVQETVGPSNLGEKLHAWADSVKETEKLLMDSFEIPTSGVEKFLKNSLIEWSFFSKKLAS